jgi:cysteine-rich secretory family protein
MRRYHPSRSAAILVAIAFAFFSSGPRLLAKDVEEKYDDGMVHLRYKVDAQNHRSGDYQEFSPAGKLKTHGTFAADKKTGTWTSFDDNGKPEEVTHWRNGMLEGAYQRLSPDGRVLLRAIYRANEFAGPITSFDKEGHVLAHVAYPRPLAEVERIWKLYAPKERGPAKFVTEPKFSPPYVAGKLTDESVAAAVEYAMLYRLLSGLPPQNLTADPTLNDLAQHGSVVVAKLGKLTHTPEKPGDMDAAFFKLGYSGCNQSNLFEGNSSLFDAVDAYMDDSDDSNIQQIGHRQWVLTPGLTKTGFGEANGFSAMHVISAGPSGNNYNFIAYPGEGYYPKALLHDGAAWSIHFNNNKAHVAAQAAITISVTPLDEYFVPGKSSAGSIVSVLPNQNANWTAIVFKTGLKSLAVGKYLVNVVGVRTTAGAPVPFSYLVDLRDMPDLNADKSAAAN